MRRESVQSDGQGVSSQGHASSLGLARGPAYTALGEEEGNMAGIRERVRRAAFKSQPPLSRVASLSFCV